MSSEHLLLYFDQISEAPDAIPRLRRFILDLAVRGKLVEQDPSDEPASELLKRIKAEKVRLEKSRVIRTPKPIDPLDETECLFSLPDSWKWVRLGEVGSITGGGTPPSKDDSCFTEGGSGIAWLTPADLGKHNSLFISHGARDLTEKGLADSSAQLMPEGTVLFTSRAPIGYTAIATNKLSTNQGFKSVVPFILDSNRYIAVYFKAFADWIDGKASGTTFKEVSGKIVSNLPFPLPPLAEQHQIVAKVDELMALCDELEAAQAKREKRRDRLVAATLHGLNNGDINTESNASPSFAESARFYFNQLPRLTTRPEHIHQLRQTILILAVRGKLVPQDLNDEPAFSLLERVLVEKQRLIKQGKLKKQDALEPVDEINMPFSVSNGWEWVKAGTLFLNVTDGFHNTPKATTEGYKYVTAKHIRPGKIDFENSLYVDEKNHKELLAKTRIKRGDILIVNIGAGCGTPAIVEVDFEFSFKNVAILNLSSELNQNYIFIFFLHYRSIIFEELIKGGAQPFLGLGMLRQLPIPLPPLAEQHRIVERVDELMALCDELEDRISTTGTTRRQLLEATLQEALST